VEAGCHSGASVRARPIRAAAGNRTTPLSQCFADAWQFFPVNVVIAATGSFAYGAVNHRAVTTLPL
jgi:hypothetical protein